MKSLLSFVVITATIFLGSCATLKVNSDRDSAIDFTKYRTFEYYGWEEGSDKIMSPFDKERVENSFAAEFAARGMNLVDEGGELVVSLYIITEQKTKTTAHTTHMGGMGGYADYYYGYGPGWGWGGGHSTTSYSQYDYEVGTLIVSVYDKAEQRLIWESIGKGTVDDNPQSREYKIPKYVKQIMSKYPVEPAKE